MILKFKLISPEVDTFFCDIEIREDQSFYQLHNCIQDTVNYDNSQLASFFLTNELWEKQTQITLLDMADNETKTLVMDKTKIGDHLSKVKDKLVYVFDFFSDRGYFLELVSIREDDRGHYPRCVASAGEPPEQIRFGDTSIRGIFDDDQLDSGEDYEDDDLDLGDDFNEEGGEFEGSEDIDEYR